MRWYNWLTLAFICNTLFRFYPFCFQFGIPEENHTSFAVGQALSWIFILQTIPREYIWGKYWKLYMIVLSSAFSNLYDEIWGNPLVFGLNERIFIVIITVVYCFGDFVFDRIKDLRNKK